MKIEIEVTEEYVKDALDKHMCEVLDRHIRAAVSAQVNHWASDGVIKKLINSKYQETVGRIVDEVLADTPKIREQVLVALTNKIKGQLTAAMRGKP